MPLENEISALTLAVKALTEVLSRASTAPTADVLEKAADIVTDVVAKVKPPKPTPAPTVPDAAASQPSETGAASSASGKKGTPPAPEYAEVKDALIKVSEKHGRDLAVACLQRLGVAKATELTTEQYRKALDLFTLALESGSV